MTNISTWKDHNCSKVLITVCTSCTYCTPYYLFNTCIITTDKEPGGEETVGALPQETDHRKPSCFTPTEGKEGWWAGRRSSSSSSCFNSSNNVCICTRSSCILVVLPVEYHKDNINNTVGGGSSSVYCSSALTAALLLEVVLVVVAVVFCWSVLPPAGHSRKLFTALKNVKTGSVCLENIHHKLRKWTNKQTTKNMFSWGSVCSISKL